MGWRRRFIPSPTFVCLAVAVCVFYQSLPILWKKTSWTLDVDSADSQNVPLEVTPNDCLSTWTALYRSVKEFKETLKNSQNLNTERRAFLYVHPLLGAEESNFYKRLLTQLRYTVLRADAAPGKQEQLIHGMSNYRDVLIYIPSYKRVHEECCEKRKELVQLRQVMQVNILSEPELLCSKERMCKVLSICPEFRNHSICSTDFEELLSREALSRLFPMKKEYADLCEASQVVKFLSLWTEVKHSSQESPLLRTYVLVTSMSPLRAFIHSTGIVQKQPNEPYIPIKLQHFYLNFVKSELASKAFNALKETIGKFLLTLEVVSEASATGDQTINRCTECFQLLTVDIVHRNPLHPTVLQDNACWVDGHMDFTQATLHTLYSFAEELPSPGEFEMIYPSISPSLVAWKNELYHHFDPMRNLGSISSMHSILLDLLKDFHIHKMNLTHAMSSVRKQNIQSTLSGAANRGSAGSEHINCSNDNDTLSHIRRIFSRPRLDLSPEFSPNIKAYDADVPFDVVTVEIGAEPSNCKSRVHLDDKEGPRVANYPLGLGSNQITIFITDESKPSPLLLGSYKITVHREDRPSLPLFDHYKVCGFVQDCGLIIDGEQRCGLLSLSSESLSRLSQAQKRKCTTGDAKGQWIVPCMSCADNRTCDWRVMSWQPYTCHHHILSTKALQQCLQDRKVLFIGDSTNRGIMYYLIERVNETLQEWQKSHDMRFYRNVNQERTMVGYSYYPQFWINATQRPTFELALKQLLFRSRPLKNTNQTILVVGGVQWLNPNHLKMIYNVLNRENLSDILVIIKSTGMGFHLPVYGIRSLSQIQVRQLLEENLLILKTAHLYGFEVVDTFSITMGRYKEFLHGKCGCHFHEVVKSKTFQDLDKKKMKLLKNYTYGNVRFSQIQDHMSNLKSSYHVMGPVNQVYSEILLSRMCT
ncbi:cadherin-like and PC-esterase domain-containing protein 1 isoform X2 [Pelobates fuscus]|uniref:cadherin-like and PC-esterase domain-containing protein 1 isoform X2 n=1 Tax=Pelobates fuscus TaxID=191477 RepID=UPI002FE45BE0